MEKNKKLGFTSKEFNSDKYFFYNRNSKNVEPYRFYYKWYGFFDKERPYKNLQAARDESNFIKRYEKIIKDIRNNKKKFDYEMS